MCETKQNVGPEVCKLILKCNVVLFHRVYYVRGELKELGLTDSEVRIYLVLLESGMLSPTELAKKTGLRRTYVYDTVGRLLDKGIINTVLVKNKKHYQAINPNVLRTIFELKLKSLDEVIPKLSKLFESSKQETRVELLQGRWAYRTMLKDILSNMKREDVVYLLGVNEYIVESAEPVYLKYYFKMLKEKGGREKAIIGSGLKRIDNPDLEYKEMDPKYLGDAMTCIHRSKVYMFINSKPYYIIEIDSQKVADTYRKQFELFWSIAK